MALLERHPPHVRRKIALFWTGGIAVVLVAIFVFIYTRPKEERSTKSPSKLEQFYEVISKNAESLLKQK